MKVLSLLLGLGLASAVPTKPSPQLYGRQDAPIAKKLIVATPGKTSVVDFNGVEFVPGSSLSHEGQHFSWIVFKEPNHVYGTDENANGLHHFTYDPTTSSLAEVSATNGSLGVVHLEFNKDKTRMVGSSFSDGTIDIWDTSADDGSPKLVRSLEVTHINGTVGERQLAPHQHQAVLDPTGRFFAVNDLGGDTVRIIATENDLYEVVNIIRLPDEELGCGPRHGAFHGEDGKEATHYLLACELSNKILSFGVTYDDTKVSFKLIHSISSFGENAPANDPTGAKGPAAGELLISKDGKSVYVTNRLTPNADATTPDSMAVFSLSGCGKLAFKQSFSTGGRAPRMMSLSNDNAQSCLFVGNQQKVAGTAEDALRAFKRNSDGSILETPAAICTFEADQETGFGPSFVQEIPF